MFYTKKYHHRKYFHTFYFNVSLNINVKRKYYYIRTYRLTYVTLKKLCVNGYGAFKFKCVILVSKSKITIT